MRIARFATWTCALAVVLMAGAATVARADAAPSASAAELKDALAKAPTTSTLANGDPGGTLTGTVNDVPVGDAKTGLTLGDVGNQVGQNKIAINFVWTLVTGFLVMFMQAGFAMVEAGLCRVKNANHTYMMNFFVYACGLFAYWIIGFAIQMGGAAGNGNLGGLQSLNTEHLLTLFGTHWGIFGECGMFLAERPMTWASWSSSCSRWCSWIRRSPSLPAPAAERWKFLAFAVSSVLMGAFTYPLYGNWAWGGGWLSQLGTNMGLGKGYCDFAGSGVVHAVGGITALAVAMIIGPRIGKFNRDGSSNTIIGHDISAVLIGCFILAFGWFGFNPGSTLGASAAGNLRIGSIAVNTMLAGCTATFGALLYMWVVEGQAGRFDERQRDCWPAWSPSLRPAALSAPLAPPSLALSPAFWSASAVAFVENFLKVDDPVGAISVHGTCGLWGVLSVGLFADGTSNYGGAWNGVTGSVTGLFYGDASQLVAQIVGCATLVGFVFTFSFVLNWILDIILGQRVSIETEVAGLDLPEMGQLGYPEFVFRPEPDFLQAAACMAAA